jgi:uroporphyrin-III C-methyltransferase
MIIGYRGKNSTCPRWNKVGFGWWGAGPGDPGLITALGLQASPGRLSSSMTRWSMRLLALSGAEKIYAGKRAGVKSCKQDEIFRPAGQAGQSGQLRAAAEGRRSLCRSGAAARRPRRWPAPGCRSALCPGSPPGSAGWPMPAFVTHRDTNHAVTFITGHGASTEN